jgi:hypothetical protein
MSIKKAQKIVNELEEKFGFLTLSYQNSELEVIKDLLDKFLELDIETEDLDDPEECCDHDKDDVDEEDSPF